MKLFWISCRFIIFALMLCAARSAHSQDNLANNTVLIIRHAEKYADKAHIGLNEAGVRRAKAYVSYFQPIRDGGLNLTITDLYAGADSKSSQRPRLTLEPLSQASGKPLDTTIKTEDAEALVSLLRRSAHGNVPLVCWRHGQIPTLIRAFGGSPESLLPEGKWPDETFDWIVVLRFDQAGKLASQTMVRESLVP
ncbi:MAG: hypothetical protein PW789_16940 [Edaphobacter sp.]|uniref:hypothetical protein n=1 Tax=Edaphobacter sp. TaxID=1934404 RepID=UPI0023860F05|nr:hypothetical protein [Edaphobacter sp.]MDE1178263.1 hypothetical protein [Edaphobacter sp.]